MTRIIPVMVMVVMMVVVMVEILRELHRLLLGCAGGEAGVVRLEHIECIRDRFQKIADSSQRG